MCSLTTMKDFDEFLHEIPMPIFDGRVQDRSRSMIELFNLVLDGNRCHSLVSHRHQPPIEIDFITCASCLKTSPRRLFSWLEHRSDPNERIRSNDEQVPNRMETLLLVCDRFQSTFIDNITHKSFYSHCKMTVHDTFASFLFFQALSP